MLFRGDISQAFSRLLHNEKKRIYFFDEGRAEDINLLGTKGTNLCEMYHLGVPLPPGFTISTEACQDFHAEANNSKGHVMEEIMNECRKAIQIVEKRTNKAFGGKSTNSGQGKVPLLLSVRSGAPVDMPGMTETILNLGINSEIVAQLALASGNAAFAYDSYRRFLQMFGKVVLGIDPKKYDEIMAEYRMQRGITHSIEFTQNDWVYIIEQFKTLAEVPEDPWKQLEMAISAVFTSWYSPQALKHRDLHMIPHQHGIAVTIQSMICGNLNEHSGSGVAFTRNPGTGRKELCGEYLKNGLGDEVFLGLRVPITLHDMQKILPEMYSQLDKLQQLLENYYKDMQIIEFAVEDHHLMILQSRRSKRSARATVKVAVDMVSENMMSERGALERIDAYQMDYFLHEMVDPDFAESANFRENIIGEGIAASPGTVCGQLVFDLKQAENFRSSNRKAILCLKELQSREIEQYKNVSGILTLIGDISSQATTQLRSYGIPVIVMARNMKLNDANGYDALVSSDRSSTFGAGVTVTIDGSTGNIFRGSVPTVKAGNDTYYQTILAWAKKYKRMKVYMDVCNIDEVRRGLEFGAEGLGIFRTESMFATSECIDWFHTILLSDNVAERKDALSSMLSQHQREFLGIFKIMNKKHISIRLADPNLEDLLPSSWEVDFDSSVEHLARKLNISHSDCKARLKFLEGKNSNLGLRGARLLIKYPEIAEMQTKAIMLAAAQAVADGCDSHPHIAVPLAGSDYEVGVIVDIILQSCEAIKLSNEEDFRVGFSVGCTMETPRSCFRADMLSKTKGIESLDFDSSALTQYIFGFTEEDSSTFMDLYLDKQIYACDPFKSIDIKGVGSMIDVALKKCRKANPFIKLGVNGQHGGDPVSIAFFETRKFDYVCCRPNHISIAKVAAAHAFIEVIRHDVQEQHYHPWSPSLKKRYHL